MRTREQILDLFENYMSSLKFPQQPAELYTPIAYSLFDGGKRIRPMLLLELTDIMGGELEDAVPCAAAIEVFHNFTLLHDDIMDNADIRRGKASVHKKWGQNVAILSGDAMVIYAYHLLQLTKPEFLPMVMREFNKMALEVCEGQQFDIDFESRQDVSIDEYMEMIRLKTAVLFAGSAKIAGIISGVPDNDCRLLYDFGLEIGLAYQLQDDYLDTYGTVEILGKNIGGDIAEGKKTFLAITALNEAGGATRRAILSTFEDTSLPVAHKVSRIKTIYSSLDVPEITVKSIACHLNKATQALEELGKCGHDVSQMRGMVQALANRNK